MAARAGVEPTTIRLRVIASTNAPPCPTMRHHVPRMRHHVPLILYYIHYIHSFIHTEHLYSASSRELLRGAPDSSTAKKNYIVVVHIGAKKLLIGDLMR